MSTALSAGKVSEHVTIGTSFHLIGWYTFCGPITVLRFHKSQIHELPPQFLRKLKLLEESIKTKTRIDNTYDP